MGITGHDNSPAFGEELTQGIAAMWPTCYRTVVSQEELTSRHHQNMAQAAPQLHFGVGCQIEAGNTPVRNVPHCPWLSHSHLLLPSSGKHRQQIQRAHPLSPPSVNQTSILCNKIKKVNPDPAAACQTGDSCHRVEAQAMGRL